MMENLLLALKGVPDTWLSPSFTPWATDVIFGILCGLVLFLLLLALFDREPSSPPPRSHRNDRKHPVEQRRKRSKAKSKAKVKRSKLLPLRPAPQRSPPLVPSLRAQLQGSEDARVFRDCLHDVQEAQGLISLLQSHLGRLPDKDNNIRQSSCQNPPGEVCKAEPDGARQPSEEPVEDAAPAMDPSASTAPLTLNPLPLASAKSGEHQEGQSDIQRLPLYTTVKSSPPGNSFLASPIPAISVLGCSSCPTKFLSRWQRPTKDLFFSTSSRPESQREYLSHHPPEASFWEVPTDRQVQAGSPSFVNPDVHKLLEMLISKRAALNLWKEKEMFGSFCKQMSSDDHLNPLGNMWKSPGVVWDTVTPESFWNVKDKQGRRPSPRQLPLPTFLEDHLQQKCGQFWGLPSLHSESLVAAAWVTRSSSHLQMPSVLFNGISNSFPHAVQLTALPGCSQAPHLPFPGAQPQTLAQIPTQTHPSFSVPIQKPSPQPRVRAPGVSCPKSWDKSLSFFATEIRGLEWPLVRKQLKRERALPLAPKRSQEVFSQLTPNLSQDNRASHGQRSVSIPHRGFISPNPQRQQLRRRLLKDQQQNGWRIRVQVSLDLMQARGNLPGVCQARDKQGPLQPSVFPGEISQDLQKMKSRYARRCRRKGGLTFQRRKDFCRGLQQCLSRILEAQPARGSASFPVKVLTMSPKKESEGDLTRPSKSDSGSSLSKCQDKKHIEQILKVHLDKKLEQINQGSVPVSVRRSWLSAQHDFPKRHAHTETRNVASLKARESCINTSCELSTLSPRIQQLLEAHVVSLRVRHRWGLPLQAFESIHLKLSETQHSPCPESPFPASADCVSGANSNVKFTSGLGKLSQPLPRKNGITKEAFLASAVPVHAPSPACEETLKAMRETQPDCDHGPSQAHLNEWEGRLPSQSVTFGLMGKAQQIGTAMGFEKRGMEPSSSSVVTKNEPRKEIKVQVSRHPCHRVATLERDLGSSQSSMAEEAREALEAKEASAWEVIVKPTVPVIPPTNNMELRRSGSSGPSKSSSPPTKSAAQGPEQPCLKTKFELRGKAEADNQPQGHAKGVLLQDNHDDVVLQDYATGVLLQDSAASVFLQDSHTNVPLAVDIVASHRALSSSQRDYTSKDVLAPQGPCALTSNGQSSQRQQEPRIPKGKDPHESQSKMSVPTGEREDNRRPSPGQQKELLAELQTPRAGGMRHSAQVKGIGDTPGSKRFQLLTDREEVSPENDFGKKKTHFPLCLTSHLKDKGPEYLLPKSQPVAPPIIQSCNPGGSRPDPDDRPIEAQSLMRALGQLLVEKLGLRQGPHASDLNQNKQFQAPVGGNSCYLRPLSSPEQKK